MPATQHKHWKETRPCPSSKALTARAGPSTAQRSVCRRRCYWPGSCLHPGDPVPRRGDANNHQAIFVSYARSGTGRPSTSASSSPIAVIVAGLVLLFYAVGLRAGAAAAAARVGWSLPEWRWGCTRSFKRSMVSATVRSMLRGRTPLRPTSPRASRALRPCAGSSGCRSYHDYALGLTLDPARTRGRGHAARRDAPRGCLADVPVGSRLSGTRLGCRRAGLLQRQHHFGLGGLGAQPGMDDLAGHRHSAQAAGRGGWPSPRPGG